MPPVYVSHIEYACGSELVTNEDLKRLNPDWNIELIAHKTGVLSRHFCAPNELPSDLAYKAATKLMAQANIPPESIDAVIFCTQSPDYVMPPNASLLHARLGLPKTTAVFDFTLACSGFIYGLAMAQSWIQSMGFRRVMLVTGDAYSKYIHPRDRSARALFGDAVAVSILEPSPLSSSGIVDIDLYSDGTGGPSFMIKAGGLRNPRSQTTCLPIRDITGNERTDEHIAMDGRAVLEFAKREIPPCTQKILTDNRVR
ncbi:hypothetical protein E3A20_19040, partial [Planctomyces bekefii]